MKQIIPAAAVLFLVTSALSVPAEAKPNAITAAEAIGLQGVAVPQPALTDGLPERTTLDPSAIATKPPKTKRDDQSPTPAPDAIPAKGSKPAPAAEGQKKAK